MEQWRRAAEVRPHHVGSIMSESAIGPRCYFRFSHVLVDPLSHLGSPQTVAVVSDILLGSKVD